MNNIPRSLFFSSIILLMVVLVSVGTFYFDNSRNVIESQQLESFESQVQQLDSSVSEFLMTFDNALQMFSQNDMVRSLPEKADKNLLQVEQMFRAFQESYPYSAYAYYVFKEPMADGRFMVTWPDTSAELKAADYDPESRLWYIGAIESSGRSTWSDPYEDATTQKPMVTVSRIVLSDADEFKGVLAIDVFLDELSNKVENFKSFNHLNAFIVSKSKGGYEFLTKDDSLTAFNGILKADWVEALDNSDSGLIKIKYNSTSYYVAYTTNRITGWKIVGIVERNKIFKDTLEVLKDVLLSTVVVFGIGILSITYISNQLTKSVKDIGHMIEPSTLKSEGQQTFLPREFDRVSEAFKEESLDAPRTTLNMLFDSETEMAKVREVISKAEGMDFMRKEMETLDEMCAKLMALRDELLENPTKKRVIQADEISKLLRRVEEMRF